jgi:hypothetical protein
VNSTNPNALFTEKSAEYLLDHYYAVNTFKGVYILGCFARRVTVYSQQIRSLNLVCALLQSRRITKNTEVAIVGAGVAGMTAAGQERHSYRSF